VTNPKVLANKLVIGHSEWCALPELNLPAIKAKTDTGAKTSALHAFNIKAHIEAGVEVVCFDIHPLQANSKTTVHCKAVVVDKRHIMSSNGHREFRYVIASELQLGGQAWPIELTLSNRDPLRYRMLLGRQALNHRTLINPSIECNQGHLTKSQVTALYKR